MKNNKKKIVEWLRLINNLLSAMCTVILSLHFIIVTFNDIILLISKWVS